MSWPLRQSTASQVIQLGPFLDTAGAAATSLTIANTDIKLRPLGATSATNKNSGGATHSANGNYYATLDATDTATVGPMRVSVSVSGALAVWLDCVVYEEAVYDALFAASAPGYVANAPVNVAQFGGTNGTFSSGRPEVNATHVGGTSQTARDLGASVLLSSGTGTGQVSLSSGAVLLQPTQTGVTIPTVTTLTGHTPQTGDSYARIGATGSGLTSLASATNLATVDTVVDAIKAVTDLLPDAGALTSIATAAALATVDSNVDSILVDTAEIGAAGAGLTAVPWNAAWDAEVQSEVADALAAYDPPTKAELDTAESNIRGADSDTLKTLSDQIDGLATAAAPQLLLNTTIATLASQTSFTLTAGSADDNAYNGGIIVVTDQSTATQKAVGSISDYVGSTKTITLSADPGIFTMAVGDTVDILAAIGSAPTVTQIRQEIDNNSTQLATIVSDTNDIQARLPAALVSGRMDSSVGAMAANTLTASALATDAVTEIQSGLATAAVLTTVGTNIDTVLADTNDIQTRLPAALVSGRIDASVGAVAANTLTASALASDAVAEIQSGLATAAALATVGTNVDAILVDTGTTLQAELDGIQADTEDIQSRLPAALVSGRIDASVGAMAANTVTAAAVAGDAVVEIQAGLATSTTVTAIKAKTDNLPANPAAASDVVTAAAVADAVWDEALAGHTTAGSAGNTLATAGAGGVDTGLLAAAVRDTIILTVATPSSRLVDADGNPLSELTLGQLIASVAVTLMGDRAGIGTRTITATLPGVAGVSVTAARVSSSVVQGTIAFPNSGG